MFYATNGEGNRIVAYFDGFIGNPNVKILHASWLYIWLSYFLESKILFLYFNAGYYQTLNVKKECFRTNLVYNIHFRKHS